MTDPQAPNNITDSQSTPRLSPCEHLEQADRWLTIAARNWGEANVCQNAAKIAELHILLADRAEFREANCGE